MVNEVHRFAWPGPDLRPVKADRFDFGLLPPALFQQIQAGFFSCFSRKRLLIVRRTE